MTISIGWFIGWIILALIVGFLACIKFVKHNPTLFGLIDKGMSKAADGISEAASGNKDKVSSK